MYHLKLMQEAVISAPFGSVLISFNQAGALARIDLRAISANTYCTPRAQQLAKNIEAYLNKAKTFQFDVLDLLSHLNQGTTFQQTVWQAISNIPLGSTISYQALAKKLGSGPRAVANACGANPLPLLIPCHRVVASHGLGGFMQGRADGLAIKQWLLDHEGVGNGHRLAY